MPVSFLAALSIVVAIIVAVFGGGAHLGDIPDIANIIQEAFPNENIPTEEDTPVVREGYNRVIRVVDGDTLAVDINGLSAQAGKTETIRLIGVDAPESVHPSKPVQCFGKEAAAKLKELLEGKLVRMEQDRTQDDKDRYGRLLRYVFLEDGRLANQLIIEEGYAHEYTYEAPYARQAEFKAAEQQARFEKRGLWADGACTLN